MDHNSCRALLASLSWPMCLELLCGPCQFRQQSCATKDVDVKLLSSHARLHDALVASPQTLAFFASRKSIPGKNGNASKMVQTIPTSSTEEIQIQDTAIVGTFPHTPKKIAITAKNGKSALSCQVSKCATTAPKKWNSKRQRNSEVKRAYDDDGSRALPESLDATIPSQTLHFVSDVHKFLQL